MAIFNLLKNPETYQPCRQDMLVDTEFRTYWLQHFAQHFEIVAKLAVEHYGAHRTADVDSCKQELRRQLDITGQDPNRFGELNLLTLDMLRQTVLRAYNLPDPFKTLKTRENAAMLRLYPQIVAEADRIGDPAEALLLLVEGIFAGNIFDLGASSTSQLFSANSPDFTQIRRDLANKRPWLVDHFAAFSEQYLRRGTYRKAIFFLDNAGSDAVLGVFPFARFLAARGATVVLAANDQPALNDLTYEELGPLLREAAALDPTLRNQLERGQIVPLNSGGTAPLIDLREVSDACNAAAADADIVFLEGMGRGLESNFDAAFTCDAVKLCMIKEPIVAQRLGGKVFDVVFRYDPAEG